MTFKSLSPSFSAAPQLSEADVVSAAKAGFGTIIDNRPDGEEPGQLSAADMGIIAKRHGLAFTHVPVKPGAMDETDVARMRAALAQSPGPVLGYCRTGARAAAMWALAQTGERPGESLMKAASDAGFDLGYLKSRLVAPANGTGSGGSKA